MSKYRKIARHRVQNMLTERRHLTEQKRQLLALKQKIDTGHAMTVLDDNGKEQLITVPYKDFRIKK